MFGTIKLKPLIISLAISLGIGGLSGFLTKSSTEIYKTLNLPPLSPPSVVFPIVWTILFILMGIGAYLVYMSHSPYKGDALKVYGLQLVVNFFWSIIFFNMRAYAFAFIWLILLLALIVIMFIRFYKVDKLSAYLQIPYLFWVLFAGYLNLAIAILN